MKNRYRLICYRKRNGKKNGMFFLHDNETGMRESLETRNKARANELLAAKNEAAREPAFNLQKARVYLAASDSGVATRTWRNALDAVIKSKPPGSENRYRWETFSKDKAIEQIVDKIVLETHAEHLLKVVQDGSVSTNVFMRRLHNFCIGMNWLPWPILAKQLWPPVKFKKKRAITHAEHEKIISRERNPERRNFYELCWHLGGSQTDIAHLNAEDIDWNDWTICYERRKLASLDQTKIKPPLIKFGERCAAILRGLPKTGPLFPYLRTVRAADRATEFKQRCEGLGIKGVTLHSYRYAWAQRARKAGYPRRQAEEALGHNSKAVHDAYAGQADVTIPSLEDYEELATKNLVQVEFGRSGPAVTAARLPDHSQADVAAG
ncbi:MAG TPA: hypothetical protein VG167_20070 [Verrucomicrobiae bacterium]|nr:hypothetical protein [Verrucomicrobiae bacterium]